jgi:hypothetical protein
MLIEHTMRRALQVDRRNDPEPIFLLLESFHLPLPDGLFFRHWSWGQASILNKVFGFGQLDEEHRGSFVLGIEEQVESQLEAFV